MKLAPRVLVSESRPHLEGREFAAEVAGAGIPTWIVADAALPLLVSGARMVWIGADAITDRGVVNKVGSFAVALAAREQSVPIYVIATRRKFLPATTRALKILEMSPDEIWPDAPPGVRPRNVYFELVPFELIRGIVVEDAVLGGSEARMVALDRALPEELAGP
jgi:translation initiation factor 2B subunit (eIF-2B alpha/beta/delta family)